MPNITELSLLYVPLEADYKHTLYFSSRDNQKEYFKSRAIYSDLKYTDYSYQRKDSVIRVNKHFDYLNGKVNYVMYKNTAYGSKWFYAFITNMEYVNDEVTKVYIQTDVMQTWNFDYTLKSCFVEREHTKDDTAGLNTVPEGLETGEYICNNVIHNSSTNATTYIVASTVDLETGSDSGLQIYNGIVNGWYYYCFNSKSELETALKDLATLRTNDSIVNIFVMPTLYLHINPDSNKLMNNWEVPKYTFWDKDEGGGAIMKPSMVNGYTPKNNKLLCYPYSYLLIDNNSGGVAQYQYELFDNIDCCTFQIYGCVTPGGSLRLVPLKYNGVNGDNFHFGLNSGKFPVCGWQSDYYTNWLTQNALNIEVQTESIKLSGLQSALNNSISGAENAYSDVMKGDIGGALLGGAKTGLNAYFIGKQQANQIKGITAMKEMHAFQSPTVSGAVSSGDINFCMGNIRFSAYQMSVKKEYAKIIDNYFSMYGYQTNRVKIPNKNHRERYWYTKTVGCEIDGAIPNNDMQIIKTCYDSGVTFWKNPSEIGSYTDSNDNLYDNDIV